MSELKSATLSQLIKQISHHMFDINSAVANAKHQNKLLQLAKIELSNAETQYKHRSDIAAVYEYTVTQHKAALEEVLAELNCRNVDIEFATVEGEPQ